MPWPRRSMNKFQDLVRRLRARMERSASREQSLDWKAADTIDHLLAECARLAAEARSLQTEAAEAERHATTAPAQPLVDAGAPELRAPSTLHALGLQEAAGLLNVSYATVFANRRALGFFQVGRQWRIWPETLREELGQRTKKSSATSPRIAPRLPAERIPPLRPHVLSPSARQARWRRSCRGQSCGRMTGALMACDEILCTDDFTGRNLMAGKCAAGIDGRLAAIGKT